MKKLLFAIALLGGMTFAACSSDDDKGSSLPNCVTCTSGQGEASIEIEWCEDEFESRDQYVSFIENLEDGGADCE